MLRKRKPHKIRKKKSIFSSRFFWFGLLAIIISAGLFYLISFSVWFQITKIEIKINEKVSEHINERSKCSVEEEREMLLAQAIQELIQPQIEQQIGFWGTRSIFLANLKEINKTLLRELPLIGKVEIRRDFPNTLVVAVEEREPAVVLSHEEQSFFVDKYGIVFEKILNNEYYYLEIESLFLTKELKLGKEILDKKLVEQILEIEQETKRIDISIEKVLIVSDRRLDVKTLENWEIYFNLKDDISVQIFHLNLVLKEKIPQEKRKNLEYIDLRFGNRVFFRYRD